MVGKPELELLRLMVQAPKVGVREWARRLGIARGTAQARINRLQDQGVITEYRPHVSAAALGLPVMAYVHVFAAQGEVDITFAQLAEIPEVVEGCSLAGDADLLCRVVARDHLHLETVLQRIIGVHGVQRTRSEIVLHRRIEPRVGAVLDQLIREADASAS
ncbi:Lrp/AsnC family transcriptional regulator [Amycolatopsis sp. YIM 10]|uniref:Lrp/AsnC family transcriptional regulator n=1 Tax=Amycolatopsis sp. YIM 10 TaxID=2653857 RepID=UPI0012901673|nr:Lrp/AsnC family transcriptional regulator [Amycolatopsis sp. YIM 10]QFU88335.1 DNA-binding transcriptional regulator AsnC [Amycolatopsis sp. YIM 10]